MCQDSKNEKKVAKINQLSSQSVSGLRSLWGSRVLIPLAKNTFCLFPWKILSFGPFKQSWRSIWPLRKNLSLIELMKLMFWRKKNHLVCKSKVDKCPIMICQSLTNMVSIWKYIERIFWTNQMCFHEKFQILTQIFCDLDVSTVYDIVTARSAQNNKDSTRTLARKSSITWWKLKSGKFFWLILKGKKFIYHFNLIFGQSVLSERNGKDFSQRKWIFSDFLMLFQKIFRCKNDHRVILLHF